MNNSTGDSKDNVFENRAYGIVTENAYVEYDDNRKQEESSWWYLCLACFTCR